MVSSRTNQSSVGGVSRRMRDEDLVAEVGAGDEEALAELYRRHAGHVFALARRILSDTELAEDVVASVFVALWRTPAGYEVGGGSLRAHLLMDARRRSLDLVAPGGDGSEVSEVAQAAAHVLSSRERQVIELAYFGGRTSHEIGAMLGLPAAEVCRIIQSGLERLRHERRVAIGPAR